MAFGKSLGHGSVLDMGISLRVHDIADGAVELRPLVRVGLAHIAYNVNRSIFYNMKDSMSSAKLLKLQGLLKERRRKVSASVTVSGEVIDGVNLLVPAKQRSKFFETALRRELRRRLRQARNAQDLSILNARATRLDRETDALLELQSDPFE